MGTQRQITVIIGCLIRDDAVLLLQRHEPECPEAHLKWELPGGKVEWGESIEAALVREFAEETGLQVTTQTLLPFTQTTYWHYAWGTQQTLCFYFSCALVQELQTAADHHVHQLQWVPLSKLTTLECLPGTVEAITVAQKEKRL